MRDITVLLLIYKSTAFLDFVMDSLLSHKNACDDRVEYLIVANDADDHVKEHLKLPQFNTDRVRHVIHENPDKSEWYIQRVYKGYNRGLRECKTPLIVPINSDMMFTDGWIDNLLKFNPDEYIPISWLVESGRMPSLAGLVSKNLGQTLATFDRKGFESFALEIAKPEVFMGGAYGPGLFKVMTLKGIGGWSLNNGNIPGDQITFHKLKQCYGLKHITVMDSIVYHLQRGESAECNDLQ